ncbi:short-chain fatty acid transporter [Permianibacter sp. IMCC34836]|uniref:short-chain fatty acid transporter n=1 Tax=Permianibacter fluminis TaxID=2738515 RepID=UPI001554040E|nr:TIGR00366 family protein [Permianibacter fluminis]NQD35902.1 short-chain fatty acid transporter [Permianibacter fluminis]
MSDSSLLQRTALRFTHWAERWFPDAFVFAILALLIVVLAAFANGAPVLAISKAFGDGFWSLIPFTMQMVMVAISGYVVAVSPPVTRLINTIAAQPGSGRSAIALIASVSMLSSLLNWALSLIFSGLLVRALARREALQMDYRAAAAAGYLGLGATWAMGLSSSAAQLQANASSLPAPLLAITGVIPFSQTIFLWQSLLLTAVLLLVSMLVAWWSAPTGSSATTAQQLGIDISEPAVVQTAPSRPGEWLEHSPLLIVFVVLLGAGWLLQEFQQKDPLLALSGLNTYNFLFLMTGMALHGRPQRFVAAVTRAVPIMGGVLIQYPLFAGLAAVLTSAAGSDGISLSSRVATAFVTIASTETYPLLMGAYSAILGWFIPSGGGKWLIEAPYVMQAAIELKVHLGWAVQIYNAAEALPNLINPFWMLPLLGVVGLKARDIVGFTALQLFVHLPLVLGLLWLLAGTLTYVPPLLP